MILKFFKTPGLKTGQLKNKLHKVLQIEASVINLETELCYYVETESLEEDEVQVLKWILSPLSEGECLRCDSMFSDTQNVIEIGPRLNFSTAFSTNVVSICKTIKLNKVKRIEVAIRYCIKHKKRLNEKVINAIINVLGDRMTECRYMRPIETFDHGFRPEKWFEVDIIKKGRSALEEVNFKLGLAFDDWDLDFYTELFLQKLKRNPTSVECFDLAQSNSEHSRHWFFKGRIILNGKEEKQSLIDMIMDTQNYSNSNNIIKFSDNSSAIEGFKIPVLRPINTYKCSNFHLENIKQHLIFTAETHNFPTGVAPFSGATTGTGGRLRDIQGIGRTGYYIAGTAGYSVGNLCIPGYDLPWEEKGQIYPTNLASPLEIIIEASNGASDYGNKFGEPLICGFTRSYGATDVAGVKREWIKPIMFSGGLGTIDANLTKKIPAKRGMEVAKIGGPVYRIGVGGGSASSMEVQGDNSMELDFGAVQRGDPEMEQKLNRIVRACAEMGDSNPILSIHDQGAGGNGNVLKELVEPAGAVIFTKNFDLGDPSVSTLELWGAEYQESDAILCKSEDCNLLKKIAAREKCPINFVGIVTGNGKIIVSEEEDCDVSKYLNYEDKNLDSSKHPVNLELEVILGKMPRKVFKLHDISVQKLPMKLPNGLTVLSALDRVLRLPSVASKRYLTNKVDRCVTGLVAQQQCVGPLHTPLADVAVTAISHFSTKGIATSIGEQPIKGLVNDAAGARMTVAEALSNLVFAQISVLQDVKCSGNWMWPAKLPGEGSALYKACSAMCSVMKELGIAIDGGKDSLSMAARINKDIVKAPGTLVISCYAPCPDICQVITPDLKAPIMGRQGCLLFIDLSYGKSRLGGTALSQVYCQLGNDVPDIENVQTFKNAFIATQKLIADKKVLAGHDISDGGLITCLLEMCFAGISGINVNITHKKSDSAIDVLFCEELGWILEVDEKYQDEAVKMLQCYGVPVYLIGKSVGLGMNSEVVVKVRDEIVLSTTVIDSMNIWEETSYQLERRQTNVTCALEEFSGLKERTVPAYRLNFDPVRSRPVLKDIAERVKVAVIREEGINGDREMAASLLEAGFDVWDVTMQDLLENQITLEVFRGVIFPGGFSYADVCGSAKGWAASFLFHSSLREQLRRFVARENTFSLGVCNGCQLMSILGWIGDEDTKDGERSGICLDHNLSERFECRWATVKIENSPSIMLKDMQDSVLGVWVAHGEGRFTFREEILKTLEQNNCVTIRYTDDYGNPTERYPMNPNGSVNGIAGICSKNGRHLAMMPHPERCTQMWQWPWKPAEWNYEASPWQRLFDNAYTWCQECN
ncbi:Phosphoribosylformylglycinamidine synthase [Trachymyrmex septentrionalis]|uniref:Phosphoribosylformylglycinamidine synthase n=1 Tax=Trachymyrmex septentrionalis TaxID=34720 RepID=A0A195FTM4_9HYME|nr:PREDICTED: phosphoribosylformylglycinamidine synthase [Trachymyrmex septentrionalis]XP_018356043.1 PREDICTED: phosphoribosylformylglycinamidine synthase [Trachymyrmex septentrionalis]KYN43813.1 Phosphoribosylformylglycinamidine synthase [Trachymyrmex septentrionalis]